MVTDFDVQNTYIFTEKDMPGFDNKMRGTENGMPAIPARLLYPERNNDRKFGAKKKFEPYFRKAIPSK